MQRKMIEFKYRHETNRQKDSDLGNAIIAVMSIIGVIFTIVTLAIVVYKLLI